MLSSSVPPRHLVYALSRYGPVGMESLLVVQSACGFLVIACPDFAPSAVGAAIPGFDSGHNYLRLAIDAVNTAPGSSQQQQESRPSFALIRRVCLPHN